MIDSSFWRERRVFLTGHTGFKGAWLSLMLERLCARTTGFGLAPATTPSLYDLARAGENLCDVRGDICDAAMLHGALRAADPDIVIHLASRPPRDGATPNMRAVERLKQTGGPDVLDASLGAPSVQAAVFVSTEAAYVSLDWMELTSASDAHVVSLHCPDPIGGGDFAIEKGAEPVRFGAPIHVLDALYGVLLLAERAAHDRDGVEEQIQRALIALAAGARGDVDGDHEVGAQAAGLASRDGRHQPAIHVFAPSDDDRRKHAGDRRRGAHRGAGVAALEDDGLAARQIGGHRGEAALEAIEHSVEAVGQTRRVFIMAQQQRAHHRRQGQGDNAGNDHRPGQGQGELLEQRPGEAWMNSVAS